MLRSFQILVILRGRNVTNTEVVVLIARLRIDQANAGQLFWMGKREAAQNDRVDDCELRGRPADAESQHKHGQKTKRFLLNENTETDAEILEE